MGIDPNKKFLLTNDYMNQNVIEFLGYLKFVQLRDPQKLIYMKVNNF